MIMVKSPPTPGVSGIPDILAIETITPVSPIAPVAPPSTARPATRAAPVSVGGYYINRYKRCGQKQIDYGQALVGGFAGAMRAKGHSVGFIRADSNASPLQWSSATDSNAAGADTVQFAYFASHGGTHGRERPGSNWLHWFLATFDSGDGCIVSTIRLNPNTWQPPDAMHPVTAMRLGDGDLLWAVIDTCRSLHISVENERDPNARTELAAANPGTTWQPCMDGVNMLFGFTGLSSDASWTSDRGVAFGRRAGKGQKLADSWVDEAYSHWCDDVPVAMSCGRSEDDARRRLKNESLKNIAPRLRAADIRSFSYIWRS
jgi:hypothetical protein